MISVSVIHDFKKKATKLHAALVYVRIIDDRKVSYISTGVSLKKGEWLQSRVCNRADSVELQEKILFVEKRVNDFVNQSISRGVHPSVADIKNYVWAKREEAAADAPLFEWIDEQIPLLDLRESTRKKYIYFRDALERFDKITRWDDLTSENLYMFDAWLHSLHNRKEAAFGNQRLSDAGVYNYHKCFKSLLNRAVKFGKIDVNPYEHLKGAFKKGANSNIEYLDDDEMAAIMNLRPVLGSQLDIARDLFIFQAFTGLAYADAQAFNAHAYKNIGGKWVFSGKRVKTGVAFTGQLLPPVVEILEKYGWKVPRMENSTYNKQLKGIALAAGIDRRLHSHMARHTFATWALNNGVSIENVGQMLGQKSVITTQLYAKVLAKSVHDDFDKLSKKIKSK